MADPRVRSLRESNMDDALAIRLRTKRLGDGLTQAELGARLGVSQQTIAAWERGLRPQHRLLETIAQYLELSGRAALVETLQSAETSSADEDAQMVRELTASWIEVSKHRTVTSGETDVYRGLIDYYRTRAER